MLPTETATTTAIPDTRAMPDPEWDLDGIRSVQRCMVHVRDYRLPVVVPVAEVVPVVVADHLDQDPNPLDPNTPQAHPKAHPKADADADADHQHILPRLQEHMERDPSPWLLALHAWRALASSWSLESPSSSSSPSSTSPAPAPTPAPQLPARSLAFRVTCQKTMEKNECRASLQLPPSPRIAAMVGGEFVRLVNAAREQAHHQLSQPPPPPPPPPPPIPPPPLAPPTVHVNLTHYDLEIHVQCDVVEEDDEEEKVVDEGQGQEVQVASPDVDHHHHHQHRPHRHRRQYFRFVVGLMLPEPQGQGEPERSGEPGKRSSMWSTGKNRVRRRRLGRTSLQPSTAYLLARAAHIRPGDVVLDCCAGVRHVVRSACVCCVLSHPLCRPLSVCHPLRYCRSSCYGYCHYHYHYHYHHYY